MTIAEMFDQYKKACYGTQTLAPRQEAEVKQAFFTGTFAVLKEVERLSMCPDTEAAEDKAGEQIGKLIREAEQWVQLRCIALSQGAN